MVRGWEPECQLTIFGLTDDESNYMSHDQAMTSSHLAVASSKMAMASIPIRIAKI